VLSEEPLGFLPSVLGRFLLPVAALGVLVAVVALYKGLLDESRRESQRRIAVPRAAVNLLPVIRGLDAIVKRCFDRICIEIDVGSQRVLLRTG